MSVFGTKPDGTPYAGSFEIHPFAYTCPGDNSGTVAEFIQGLNDTLIQGGDRFGSARLRMVILLSRVLVMAMVSRCFMAKAILFMILLVLIQPLIIPLTHQLAVCQLLLVR